MELEIYLFRFINDLSHQLIMLDQLMKNLSLPHVWVFVAMVLFVFGLRTKDGRLLGALLSALIALAITDLISFEVIKPLIARERPCWLLANVKLFDGRCGGSYGFTSNHAANAFAVWTIIGKTYGWRSVQAQVVLILATAICISRVYLGVHFVGDVVGGAILGFSVASSLWALGLSKIGRRFTNLAKKLPDSAP